MPAPDAPPAPAAPAAPAAGGEKAPAAGDAAPAAPDAAKPSTDVAKPAEEPKPADAPKAEEPKKEAAPAPDATSKAAAVAAIPPMLPVCAPIPPEPCRWRGVASARFRGRVTTDGDHDLDLYEYLRLQYRKESEVGWSGSIYGRLAEDLDGDGSEGDYDPFNDVDSSYDSLLTGRLYHLFASYRFQSGPVEQVRIGRQDIDGGYPFLVDGVHVTTAPTGSAEFQATGFIGLPAYIYEDSPEGDFICGLGVAFRPWKDADARVDWVYVVDDNGFYGSPENNLYNLELRQKFTAYASGRLWYEQVDSHPREIGASGLSYLPEHEVSLRGSFKSQLETENALVWDVDAFSALEQTLYPYWDAHLSASKAFQNLVTIEGGVTARGLWDSGDESTYNRQFGRFYGTISRDCFPRRDWTLSLTGEYWASHDDVFSGGFDATYRPSTCFRLSTGIDYALYRTDIYSGTERYDSYDLYARVTFVPAASWKAHVSFIAEDDSEGTFFTLQAGLAYEF